MTRTKTSLAACLALLAGFATPAGSATTLAAGDIAPDGSVVTCRSIAMTGSRFPLKECKSEKAWEELDAILAANAKAETDTFQRVNTGCATGGVC